MNRKENQQSTNLIDQNSATKERIGREFQRLFDDVPNAQKSRVNNSELWQKARKNISLVNQTVQTDLKISNQKSLESNQAFDEGKKINAVDQETFKKMHADIAIQIFNSGKSIGINDAYKQAFLELTQKYKKEFSSVEKAKLQVNNKNIKKNTERLTPHGLAGVKAQIDILKKKSIVIGGTFINLLSNSLNKARLNPLAIAQVNESLYEILSSLEFNSREDMEIEGIMNGLLDFIDSKNKNLACKTSELDYTNTIQDIIPNNFEDIKNKLPVKLATTLHNLQLLRPDLYNSPEIKLLARKTKLFSMGDFKLFEEIKSSIKDLDKVIKVEVGNKYNQILNYNEIYPKYNQDISSLRLKLSLLLQEKNFSLVGIIPEMNNLKLKLDQEQNTQLNLISN